jgi:hypothetical protein
VNHINEVDTHTNQSIANRRETSCVGASIVDSTTNMSAIAALGTLADEKLAAVDAKLHIQRKCMLAYVLMTLPEGKK